MPTKPKAATVPAQKVSTPLASLDPSFPPIEVRYMSLKAAGDLTAWAKEIGATAKTGEEAVMAILRHEYGDKAFETWEKKE